MTAKKGISAEKKRALEEKMAMAQAGDKRAYAELLREITGVIRSFLYKKISQTDDIEDIVQEVLVSIHKARHTYDASRPLIPWVLAITHYRMSDYLRQQYKTGAYDRVEYTEVEEQLPTHVTKTGETAELVDKALDALPEKQQVIVRMMKMEGYSAKEVAKKLNMNVSAVKVSAHRAYKTMKARLEEDI